DGNLHRVADVADATLPGTLRVRHRVTGRVRVLQPDQSAVVDDEVGITVEPQKGREPADALLDESAEEDAARRGDVAADQQIEIAELPGEQRAAPETAERDAVASLVGVILVLLTFGIVELARAAADHDVGARFLAEVQLGPIDAQPH